MTSTGSRDSFVHLHVHTEYSMLDGAARLGDLFAETSRMDMPALAMTDHGNVFGAYDFWKRGRDAGVKPIIGRRPTSPPAPTAPTRPGSAGPTAVRTTCPAVAPTPT